MCRRAVSYRRIRADGRFKSGMAVLATKRLVLGRAHQESALLQSSRSFGRSFLSVTTVAGCIT